MEDYKKGTAWALSGPSVGPQWALSGHWALSGPSVGPQCALSGPSVGPQWALSGPSVGRLALCSTLVVVFIAWLSIFPIALLPL